MTTTTPENVYVTDTTTMEVTTFTTPAATTTTTTITATIQTTTTPPETGGDGLGAGAIAGIVVGCVLAVALIVLLVCCCRKRSVQGTGARRMERYGTTIVRRLRPKKGGGATTTLPSAADVQHPSIRTNEDRYNVAGAGGREVEMNGVQGVENETGVAPLDNNGFHPPPREVAGAFAASEPPPKPCNMDGRGYAIMVGQSAKDPPMHSRKHPHPLAPPTNPAGPTLEGPAPPQPHAKPHGYVNDPKAVKLGGLVAPVANPAAEADGKGTPHYVNTGAGVLVPPPTPEMQTKSTHKYQNVADAAGDGTGEIYENGQGLLRDNITDEVYENNTFVHSTEHIAGSDEDDSEVDYENYPKHHLRDLP